MGIQSEIASSYRRGDVIVKLVYLNAALFLLIRLSDLLALAGVASVGWIVPWVAMPVGPGLLLRPWTLLTNIVAHYDLLHFLFNLLCLYWLGGLFMRVFDSDRRALLCYVVGGVTGSLFALLGLIWWQGGVLLGASGAIMALLLAATAARPDMEVWVTFFGQVKLKYISLVYIGISVIGVLGMTGNMGGNLAHLGGVVAGVLLGRHWLHTPEYDSSLRSLLRRQGRRKSTMRATFEPNPDWRFNAQRADNDKEVDRILEKVKAHGYNALTADEKRKLFEQSNK